MSSVPSDDPPAADDALRLAELALTAEGLDEFGRGVLPGVARMAGSSSAFLHVTDPRAGAPRFYQHGLASEEASQAEALCAERAGAQTAGGFLLRALRAGDRCVGLVGIAANGEDIPARGEVCEAWLRLLAGAIGRLAEREESQRQQWHLNAYLTISSMLAKSLDLHELLEISLHCCMEAVAAEAASVLLLDDAKESFHFYQVAGPAAPALMAASFPADRGLAGSVLRAQQPEIVHDVAGDERFYGKVDSESGFRTRNMIAVPLTAGEERIGVLEVLNKSGGAAFTVDEQLLLVSIAEEIAFAIRNARMFEYVVNTYCKQRQGQMSCKGCKRPLGSWTPCVRYRESSI